MARDVVACAQIPLQVVIAFWSVPLVQHAIGAEANGAYVFAWGFGFIQFLLEFGMGRRSAAAGELCLDADDRACGQPTDRLRHGVLPAMAVIQMIILLAIAYLGLPPKFQGESRRLIVGLLWIPALSAPFFGLLTVASSILQAARRYEFLPRLDLVIVILRFAILSWASGPASISWPLSRLRPSWCSAERLLPAFWVIGPRTAAMPRMALPRRADMVSLLQIGFYIFLMQLSVVLADKLDSTILGYALPDAKPGPSITVYQNVSKPFFQIRQTAGRWHTSWFRRWRAWRHPATSRASTDSSTMAHDSWSVCCCQ